MYHIEDNIVYFYTCFIGKKGTYNGSSGLTIAYLSGTESSDGKSGEIHFSQQDVSSLLLPIATDNKFQGVDILITSQWPQGVDRYGIPVVCTPQKKYNMLI